MKQDERLFFDRDFGISDGWYIKGNEISEALQKRVPIIKCYDVDRPYTKSNINLDGVIHSSSITEYMETFLPEFLL